MVPRDRWLATGGLLALSTIAILAVFFEIAAHGSTTVVLFHGTPHTASAGLITAVIAGLTVVMFAILRPWSYPKDCSARAWAGIIALVAMSLFGVRFLGHAGPELTPVVWWMLLVAAMCAALVVQTLILDLRGVESTPRARLLRDRR